MQQNTQVLHKKSFIKKYTSQYIFSGTCLKLTFDPEPMDTFSTFELQFSNTDLETLPHISMYITSEDNSDGILFNMWNNGQELKARFHKNWIDHHVWMTLFPKKINSLKSSSNCTDKTIYQQLGSKLQKLIYLNCTKKCLPRSLRSVIPPSDEDVIPIIPKCKTKEEEKCAFSAARDILKFSEVKKTCSIYQYSGEFDYWTPEKDSRPKDNNTFSFGWWFPTPGTVKVKEEFLIYDTINLTSAVASTLGMFIGFSFSNVIGFAFRFIQNKWLKGEY